MESAAGLKRSAGAGAAEPTVIERATSSSGFPSESASADLLAPTPDPFDPFAKPPPRAALESLEPIENPHPAEPARAANVPPTSSSIPGPLDDLGGLLLDDPFLRRFRVLGVLGRGATGIVLRAFEVEAVRDVAVKILVQMDPMLIRRFKAEWDVLTRLRHPRIIEVYDTGDCRGFPYLTMELADGETLKERLAGARMIPVDQVVTIIHDVLEGLFFLHEQGVVHRDIKPANLFLLKSGQVKIGDFGVAVAPWRETGLTAPGSMIGTPKYMPPEMVLGLPITASSDIYSTGVVLFEALVGRPPYLHDSVAAMLTAHIKESVPSASALRPDLPRGLDGVLRRALAKRPEDRYPTASAFAKDLVARFADETGAPAGRHAPDGQRAAAPAEADRPRPSHPGVQSERSGTIPVRAGRKAAADPVRAAAPRPQKTASPYDLPEGDNAWPDQGPHSQVVPFGKDTGKLPAPCRGPALLHLYAPWVVAGGVVTLLIIVYLCSLLGR